MLITKQLQEPKFTSIQTISDDRGFLVPMTDQIGEELIKRSYIVEDYGRGVIRGLHYHKKEFKIFTIVSGAGKFITFKLKNLSIIETLKFIILYCVSSYLNALLNEKIFLLTKNLKIAFISATISCLFINFFGLRFFVFNKNNL